MGSCESLMLIEKVSVYAPEPIEPLQEGHVWWGGGGEALKVLQIWILYSTKFS